jgi:hypothetical protein
VFTGDYKTVLKLKMRLSPLGKKADRGLWNSGIEVIIAVIGGAWPTLISYSTHNAFSQ